MGNCVAAFTDPQTKYQAGGEQDGVGPDRSMAKKREAESAVALLTGSLAFSSLVRLARGG